MSSKLFAQGEPIFNPDQCFAVADEPRPLDVLIDVDLITGVATEIGIIQYAANVEAIALIPDLNAPGVATIYAADAKSFGYLDIVPTGSGSQEVFYGEIGRFGRGNGTAGDQRFNDVDGMTYDIVNDILYGVLRRDSGASDLLFVIDRNTGKVIPEQFTIDEEIRDYAEVDIIDGLHDVDDIAIHPETRRMYGVINDNGSGGILVQIDPDTGEILAHFTIVDQSNQTVDDLEGLAFSSNLTLYGSSGKHGPDDGDSNQLFEINLNEVLPSSTDPGRLVVRAESVASFGQDADDVEGLGCLTTLPGSPAIDVEKSTNGVDADEAGTGPEILMSCPVTWDYTVTNTGDLSLTDVTLVDDKIGPIQCPQSELGVGESMVCSFSSTASQASYANLATVTALSTRAEVTDSDPSHYTGLTADIQIEKATNGQDADDAPGPYIPVGEAVNWTYVVTNNGDVRLNEIQVTDDRLEASQISCPAATLAPGESMTCTAEGIAVIGPYRNVGSVQAMPENGCVPVNDTDPSNYFGVQPGITLQKSTNGIDADLPEDGPTLALSCPVLWQYEIENTGNLDLEQVTLQDDKLGAITCPGNELAVGETMICEASGSATEGAYANIGTVTAVASPTLATLTATDPSHYNGQVASIDIEKSTNGQDADEAPGPSVQTGATVTWTYVVTNTGVLDLEDVIIVDDQVGDIECPSSTLAAGASMVCEATGVAIPGQYANLATVAANAVDGCAPVTDSDPSHYFGIEPGLDISQTVTVTWSYQVTNTGQIDLENVAVNGGEDVTVSCPQSALAVNEAMSCEATGPQADFGTLATVTANPVGSSTLLTRAVPATPITGLVMRGAIGEVNVRPGVEIPLVKGSGAPLKFHVTNTGTFTVERLTAEVFVLPSDTPQPLVCPQTALAPGVSMTCKITPTVEANSQGAVATIFGYPTGSSQPIAAHAVAMYQGVELATVGGRLFIDELDRMGNANGLQDPGERSLEASAIEIILYRYDGTEISTVLPNSDGSYEFTGLLPDDYYLGVRRPITSGLEPIISAVPFQGYHWAEVNQGSNNRLDSDMAEEWNTLDDNQARTEFFRLSSGDIDLSWDFGFKQVTINGTIYIDENADGEQNNDEPDFLGAKVSLSKSDDINRSIQETSTTSQGEYEFQTIDPGIYLIKVTPPDGYRVELDLRGRPGESVTSFRLLQETITFLPVHTNQLTSQVAGGK
ncbi:MAG: SdrD B-like domain-containing protein [Chloroflexota bacterium]